jgi:predicted acetyltransferase
MRLLRRVPEAEKTPFRTMLTAYLIEDYAQDYLEGRFDPHDFPTFDAYWTAPFRHPFWIERGGQPAGLALVSDRYAPSGQDVDHGLVEFYVAPEARRAGLGMAAALALFRAMPGVWELAVHGLNPVSMAFWPRVIEALKPLDWRRLPHKDINKDSDVVHRFTVG